MPGKIRKKDKYNEDNKFSKQLKSFCQKNYDQCFNQ